MADNKQSSGVLELISRLRQEGVATGESLAEQIVANARKESMHILDDARAEADKIIADARLEREKFIENGNAALKLASRDTLLRVREACFEEFKNRLKRLVAFTLQDRKFLEELILEVAHKTKPEDAQKRTRVLLPAGVVTQAELAREVSNVQPGSLAAFVLGLTADVLRDGLTFGVSDDPSPGIKIQIVEDDVQLELTDETLTTLLLQYLAPRYRAVLEKDE
jgi:V/A-type H+-transporting ATPase subunit E